MRDHKLKALQKKWYARLKKEGFKDIEEADRDLLKTWHSHYFYHRYDERSFQSKQDYYRRASQFFYEYRFSGRTEKEVWRLHSEGVPMREIERQLREKKMKKAYLFAIFKTIEHLNAVMKEWDFSHE